MQKICAFQDTSLVFSHAMAVIAQFVKMRCLMLMWTQFFPLIVWNQIFRSISRCSFLDYNGATPIYTYYSNLYPFFCDFLEILFFCLFSYCAEWARKSSWIWQLIEWSGEHTSLSLKGCLCCLGLVVPYSAYRPTGLRPCRRSPVPEASQICSTMKNLRVEFCVQVNSSLELRENISALKPCRDATYSPLRYLLPSIPGPEGIWKVSSSCIAT